MTSIMCKVESCGKRLYESNEMSQQKQLSSETPGSSKCTILNFLKSSLLETIGNSPIVFSLGSQSTPTDINIIIINDSRQLLLESVENSMCLFPEPPAAYV